MSGTPRRRLVAIVAGAIAVPLLIASAVVGAAQLPRAHRLQVQILQPDPSQARAYVDAGVDLVTLELGWDAYEPSVGTVDRRYVARQQAAARAYASAGLGVVLDLGLQYPPSWARELPGETGFVNQYGQRWHGSTGLDPVDGVWNAQVRAAESAYLARVADDFRGLVQRVRIGGLLSGELRLPPASGGGRTDSLWGFGADAVAASPDPGWRPGSGSVSAARAWFDFYLGSVSEYGTWLTGTVGRLFGGLPLDVLLPGWGIRPGAVDAAAAARASPESIARNGDDLAGGLDWPRQVASLRTLGLELTAVTTWLDAPSHGTDSRSVPPVAYLAGLVRGTGIGLAGENTGGNTDAAAARLREQAQRYGLARVTWLPGSPGAPASAIPVRILRGRVP